MRTSALFTIFFALALALIGTQAQTVVQISDCVTLLDTLSSASQDTYYQLGSDLYCSGIITQPLPPFAGTLDGRGYAIIGLFISPAFYSGSSLGLFSALQAGAVVKNLYFLDCTVQATLTLPLEAGMLAGTAYCASTDGSVGGCTISNVHVGTSQRSSSNTVQTYGKAVGGLIGIGEALTISNCTVRDTLVAALDKTLQNVPTASNPATLPEGSPALPGPYENSVNGDLKRTEKKAAVSKKPAAKAQAAKQTGEEKPAPMASRRVSKRSAVGSRKRSLLSLPKRSLGKADRNPPIYGGLTFSCTVSGGLVGAVKDSTVSGSYQLGITGYPEAVTVANTNIGSPFAAGLIGVAYNTNITQCGVFSGTVTSSGNAGAVVGLYQGAGTSYFFRVADTNSRHHHHHHQSQQSTQQATIPTTNANVDQLFALRQVTVVANEVAGGIFSVVLDTQCSTSAQDYDDDDNKRQAATTTTTSTATTTTDATCYCPTFTNLHSGALLVASVNTSGGLIGAAIESHVQIDSAYYFNPAQSSANTNGFVGSGADDVVEAVNCFTNLAATKKKNTVLVLDTTSVTENEQQLLMAVEAYFDPSLWIGNNLNIIYTALNTDSQTDKGVINFDDVSDLYEEPYNGLIFKDLEVVDVATTTINSSIVGLPNSVVSPGNVAVSKSDGKAEIKLYEVWDGSQQYEDGEGSFNFNSVYITSLTIPNLLINVTAYAQHNHFLYTTIVAASANQPTLFAPHWNSVVKVKFHAYAPTNGLLDSENGKSWKKRWTWNQGDQQTLYFAIDNLNADINLSVGYSGSFTRDAKNVEQLQEQLNTMQKAFENLSKSFEDLKKSK